MPKIAIAQIEVEAGHPDINTEKILRFVKEAKVQNADVVIFPEKALSGHLLGNITHSYSFIADCINFGQKIIDASTDITIIFGNVMTAGLKTIVVARNGEPHDITEDFKINLRGKDYRIGGKYADFGILIDNSPYYVGKSHSSNSHYPLFYVNAVGIQNTGKTVYTFDGSSAVYNSYGDPVLVCEPFTECLKVVELDEIDQMPKVEIADKKEIAEIYRSISYGTEKFLKQLNMNKVVIGISGGIDSAVAAALYTKILGSENVYLVNMPSVFNSATTRGLSEQLAKNLGCKYAIMPIQESVDWTVKQIESTAIKYFSDGTSENLHVSKFVRENIQARDRSSRILAALAASIGGVFTCNANKAESTVGYATLYGDEAGFFSALADLWKFQIYALADYLNAEVYGREVIPQGIIDIVPSAELSDAQNVDEGKGDPLKYPYHDFLLRAFVEMGATPENILELYATEKLEKEIGCEEGLVNEYFPTVKDFIDDLEKWWRQYKGIAVAKRIQSPPILAVSMYPFGSFDESQYSPHFTLRYKDLKSKLLAKN